MSDTIKSTFWYKKYVIRDMTSRKNYVFGTSQEASKKFDEIRLEKPNHKLLYEINFPNYKQSCVERLNVKYT
jgi:hypothetical protein